VNRLVLIAVARVDETGALKQSAQVIQRDASVDLYECAFYDVLELGRVERARTGQSKQVSPRVRREPPPFVRAQHPKSHEYSVHVLGRIAFAVPESKKGRNCGACSTDPLLAGPIAFAPQINRVGQAGGAEG
jgi:hypothetical protein